MYLGNQIEMFIRGSLNLPSEPIARTARTDGRTGGFSAACRGTIKCNFTAALQVGKERFFGLFQIFFQL